jgi:hypothetical protein
MCNRRGYVFIVTLSAALALSGCSGANPDATTEGEGDYSETLAGKTVTSTFEGAFEAVQSPLVDLNIKRETIPQALQDIAGNPYVLDDKPKCSQLAGDVAALDAMLGPDMQKNKRTKLASEGSLTDAASVSSYTQEGASMLQNEAIGFVAGKASIIPFRGLVRRITGASDHAKEVALAYESGKLRRAYLKGMMSAMKCAPVSAVTAEKQTSPAKDS